MADTGQLSFTITAKDEASAIINKITGSADSAEKKVNLLRESLIGVQKSASKAMEEINGISKVKFSTSELNKLNKGINTLIEQYAKLYVTAERKIELGLNTKSIEEQIDKIQSRLGQFYKEVDGKVYQKNAFDNFDVNSFAANANVFKEISKAQEAQVKEYIKYQNLAQDAMQQIELLSAKSNKMLMSSIDRYGANDPTVSFFQDKLNKFKALQKEWEELINKSKKNGSFPEDWYRNMYGEHRAARTEMNLAGIDLTTRDQNEKGSERLLKNYEKQQKLLTELNQLEDKFNSTKSNGDSALEKTINSQLEKIAKLKEAINNVDLRKSNPFTNAGGQNLLGGNLESIKNASQAISKIEKLRGMYDSLKNENIGLRNASFAFVNPEEVQAQIKSVEKAMHAFSKTMSDMSKNAAPLSADGLNRLVEKYKDAQAAIVGIGKKESAGLLNYEKIEAEAQNIRSTIATIQKEIDKLYDFKNRKENLLGDVDTTNINNAINNLERLKQSYEALKGSDFSLDPLTKANLNANKTEAIITAQNALKKATENVTAAEKEQIRQQREAESAEKTHQQQLNSLASTINKVNGAITDANSEKYKFVDASAINQQKEKLEELLDKLKSLKQQAQNGPVDTGKMNSITQKVNDEIVALQRLNTSLDQEGRKQNEAAAAAGAHKRKLQEQEKEIDRLCQQYHKLSSASKDAQGTIGALQSTLMQFAPIYGIQQLVMSVIEVGGEIEKQHIALQTILGDLQNANTLFEDLKGLAIQSPFTFGELTKDVKQLAAYNIEYDQLYDTTKRLADISSGLGVSFERIALAFGQVKSRSWLDAKELRQFAYAGVPMLQSLSDYYTEQKGETVSKAQVRKMITNREVSFEDVQKVLWDMTDEGGKFYNMQLTLSETLLGRYNKLKDAWEIMLSGFAKGDTVIGSTFKTILDFLTSILLNINTVIPAASAFMALFTAKKVVNFGSNVIISKAETAEAQKAVMIKVQQMRQEGAITAEKVQQLIITKQLSTAEAVQLGLLTKMQAATMNVKLAAAGIGKVFSGIWTAMGGWVGVAIAGIAYVWSYFSTKSSDMRQAISQSADEIKDRLKQINDFKDAHINIDTSDVKKAKDAIEDYVEFIKQNAPYMYNEITADVFKETNTTKQLEALKNWVNTLQDSAKEADKINKEIVESTKSSFDYIKDLYENYTDNKNSRQKSVAQMSIDEVKALADKRLRLMPNSAGAASYKSAIDASTLKESQKYLAEGLSEQEFAADIEPQINNLYEKIREAFGENASKIKSDAKWRATYKMLRENLEEGINDEFKGKLNTILDAKFGINVDADAGDALIKGLMEKLNNPGPEVDTATRNLMKTIANKIRYNENLTSAEKDVVSKLMNKAGNDIRDQYPDNVDRVIKNLLASSNFVANIRLHVDVDRPEQLMQDLRHSVDSPEFSNALERILKGRSLTEAQKAAKDEVDKLQAEIAAYKSNPTAKGAKDSIAQLEKKLQLQKDVLARVGMPKEEKKTSSRSGSQRDYELDAFKKRVEVIKKLITLYEKYRDLYGNVEAMRKTNAAAKKAGVEEMDWSNAQAIYEKLAKEAPTGGKTKEQQQARTEYKKGLVVEGENKALQKEEEDVKALASAYKELNSQLESQYKLRDSIRQKYGDKVAAEIGDNAVTYTEQKGKTNINLKKDYATDLRDRLKSRIEDVNKRDNKQYTVVDSLKMNDKEINDAYGKDDDIILMIKDLRQAKQELENEARDVIIAEFDKLEGATAKSERIMNEYLDTLNKIQNFKVYNQDGTVNEETTKKYQKQAQSIAEITSNRQIMDNDRLYKMFESIPQLLSNDNLNNIKTQLINQLNREYQKGVISLDKFNDGLKKVDSTFAKVAKSKGAIAETSYYGRRQEGFGEILRNMRKNDQTSYEATDSKRDRELGLIEKQLYSLEYISDEFEEANDNFRAGLDKIFGALGALQSVFTIVGDAIYAAGGGTGGQEFASLFSNTMNGFSTFSQTFNQVAEMFTTMSDNLKSAGGWFAVAGAVLGFITSFFTMEDTRRQEAAKYHAAVAKYLNSLVSRLDDFVGNLAGGVYSADNSEKMKDYYQEVADKDTSWEDRMKSKYGVELNAFTKPLEYAHYLGLDARNTKNGTSDEVLTSWEEARDNATYYSTTKLDYEKQITEYQKAIANEENRKNPDDSAIEDYKTKIADLKQDIEEFAQTMAESLYGIDVTSYAESLASALTDAWASGTNSAKAYKEAAESALKDVATSMLQQKIIGTYLDNAFEDWFEMFDEKNATMDDELYSKLGEIFSATASKQEAYNNALDTLNEVANQYGYSLKDSATSSLSSNIAGITEDTADLLASYLNAIREDVSVNRGFFRQIVETLIPNVNTTLDLSLSELRDIKSTLDVMALSMNNIEDRIEDVVMGRRNFNVVLKNVS